MAGPFRVYLEVGRKRVFAGAMDWPGWCRSGGDEESAIETLVAYRPRYAPVARRARLRLPVVVASHLEVVERLAGDATTDFGAPGAVPEADRATPNTAQARRQAALVEATWAVLDDVVAGAPTALRKGPRGGGRDRDAVFGHVLEAEGTYARKLGLRLVVPAAGDAIGMRRFRSALSSAIAGGVSPVPGAAASPRNPWPTAYAARRVAWHALDHAWEIEDRS